MVCCTMLKVTSVGSYEKRVIPKSHSNANISRSTNAAKLKKSFFNMQTESDGVLYVVSPFLQLLVLIIVVRNYYAEYCNNI